MPFASSAVRVRGCDGEDERAAARVDSAATIRRSRSGSRVRLAVDRQHDVRPVGERAARAARSARTAASRRPSRRRRPRRGRGTPSARELLGGALVRAEQQRRRCRSTAIRLRSSGIERSKLRSPASTCATGTLARRRARRRASSSCRRRRAPSRAARARPPRGSRGAIACGVGGVQVEPVARLREAELLEEDLRTSRGPSAGPCAARPRRSRASRSATESGPDLMNCGRLPTTERTFTPAA